MNNKYLISSISIFLAASFYAACSNSNGLIVKEADSREVHQIYGDKPKLRVWFVSNAPAITNDELDMVGIITESMGLAGFDNKSIQILSTSNVNELNGGTVNVKFNANGIESGIAQFIFLKNSSKLTLSKLLINMHSN